MVNMENIESHMESLICNYITKHIKSNLRVDVHLTDIEAKRITDIRMDKELKDTLRDIVKLIPDNVSVQLKKEL
jgi:hypothetical protein